MKSTPLSRAWLVLSVCLLWDMPAPVGAIEPSVMVSKELLDHAGLDVLWRATLPLLNKETIDTMIVLDDRLYIRSSRNYVWSMDWETGKPVFARSIAFHDLLVVGWTAYHDRLIAVINNQIVELDKNTGVQQRAGDPGIGVVAPVARNSEYFYVPGGDRRLHAFKASDMVGVFNGGVSKNPMITSVWADDEAVVVGTDGGNVMAMAIDMPKRLWQFNAAGPIVGQVVHNANSFYFASKDTDVYRIDQVGSTRVSFVWRYQTQAILDRGPRVTSSAVYQYALYRALNAIDKESGTALWVLPEGLDLLSEAGHRAYVLTKNNTLAVMDNAAGKCVCCANVGVVAKYAPNVADGKIYIADDRGHVLCLQPQKPSGD
jgi:outer membrane protein assembly factor BamB